MRIIELTPPTKKTNPRVIELTPPTPQGVPAPQQPPEEPGLIDQLGAEFKNIGDNLGGALETGLNLGSSIIAEPVAGITGLAKTITSGPEAGEEVVKNVREVLTIPPVTEAGRETLGSLGEALQPVGEALKTAESGIGDFVFEKTESPALAALATTFPTAILELIGFKGTQKFLKGKRTPSRKQVNKAIRESAPSVDQLKNASRGVFKEIDELGASVKPQAYQELVGKLDNAAKEAGLSAGGTPKASSILNEFKALLGDEVSLIDPSGSPARRRLGRDISLGELDDLRTKAQGVAKSTEPAESAIGVAMIDTTDSFLDATVEGALKIPDGITVNVGKRYQVARKLWGQAKRSEMIQEAFEKAGRQASGFENGIRAQFRGILNNKKRNRFFSEQELAVLDEVVKGSKKQNFFKLLGRFGFSEGQAINIIGGALGFTAGTQIAGRGGGVLVSLAGTAARKLAQLLTKDGGVFADSVIRAGRDGRKIATAYLKHVTKGQRSAEELSQFFLRPDIDLSKLKGGKMLDEAVQIAIERRKTLAVAAGMGSAAQVAKE